MSDRLYGAEDYDPIEDRINALIGAVETLADQLNQLGMCVEALSQRRVEFTQSYDNDTFERARKARESVASLIPA